MNMSVLVDYPPETRPGQLEVAAEVLQGCRAASLEMGGPRIRMLGVTSAQRGEGRTMVALGLAAVHQRDYGHSVVLVDLDLESAGLTRRLGGRIWPGISDIFRGETANLDQLIQPVCEGITLLPPGSAGADAPRIMVEFLRSGLVERLRELDCVVIADLAPLLGSSIGRPAAGAFDQLLMVVRSGITPVGRIQEAIDNLPVEPRILLNGTKTSLPRWLQRLLA